MELRQLRSFVLIVEQGSIGKAAKHLNVGTSVLSQQLSKLESELATRLLQRSPLGVTLTPAGLAFLKQARQVLRYANQAIEAAQSSRLVGYVSVGFPPSTASILGVHFIRLMAERYPDIKVHIVESLSGNLIKLINNHQLDLAIIFNQPSDKNWTSEPLINESMSLIGNNEFFKLYHLENYLEQEALPLNHIESLPLALPSTGHGLRRLIDKEISKLNIIYEIDGLSLLMKTVANLCVATIQPSSIFINQHYHHLNSLKIINPTIERTNYLVSLSEEVLSPSALAAKAVIRASTNDLIQQGTWLGTSLI